MNALERFRMFRFSLALLLLATAALAQPPKELTKDAPPGAKEPPPITVELRKFTASAAPAPVPALKYELLPRLRERVPGNAALAYHRAYLLRPTWPRDATEGQKLQEKLISWEETPIDKLPVDEVKKYLAGHALSFRALEDAVRLDRCDWELNLTLSVANIDMLLPEVQTYRELTRFLRMRLRVELAENDFAAAVRTAQTMLRLGRDVGEGPTMIHALVGIAISTIALGSVEEISQRPGAPNLYWALTSLPRPLIDPRASHEGEARLFDNLFPNAKALERGPVSEEKAKAILGEMMGALQQMGGAKEPAVVPDVAPLVAASKDAARKQLAGFGYSEAALAKMPDAQAVALRAITAYRVMNEDAIKCFHLSYPEGRAEFAKLRARAKELVKASNDPIVTVFGQNVAPVEKCFEAHARVNRRVALMRAIEAVRMHAAANGGKLPEKLTDVKLVPVPLDPYTDQPFVYDVKGDTFGITGAPPAGEQPSFNNQMRFEVTLRAK
jgi:hypothetical protein